MRYGISIVFLQKYLCWAFRYMIRGRVVHSQFHAVCADKLHRNLIGISLKFHGQKCDFEKYTCSVNLKFKWTEEFTGWLIFQCIFLFYKSKEIIYKLLIQITCPFALKPHSMAIWQTNINENPWSPQIMSHDGLIECMEIKKMYYQTQEWICAFAFWLISITMDRKRSLYFTWHTLQEHQRNLTNATVSKVSDMTL